MGQALSPVIGRACSWPASECRHSTLVLPHAERTEGYAALVRRRKACRSLTNPGKCEGGIQDSDQIGPWSLWQGNLSADLLVVGQDWGDTRSTNGSILGLVAQFRQETGGPCQIHVDPSLPARGPLPPPRGWL